jgi:hypothetical protein
VGERFRVAGRVTARDRTDFHQILIRLWPSTGDEARAEREYGDISRSGSFSVDLELRDGREGQYMVETFLFWPNATHNLAFPSPGSSTARRNDALVLNPVRTSVLVLATTSTRSVRLRSARRTG